MGSCACRGCGLFYKVESAGTELEVELSLTDWTETEMEWGPAGVAGTDTAFSSIARSGTAPVHCTEDTPTFLSFL